MRRGFLLWSLLLIAASSSFVPLALAQPCDPSLAQPPLCASDVQAILNKASTSLDAPLVIAVVDRVGNVLGVFRKTGAPQQVFGNFAEESTFFTATKQDAVEVAIALARTAAFFSNNQAPLSSRTVRFISGIHFPPGVSFTPNAALYGIENTNRGCEFNAPFNLGKEVPRAKALSELPCNSSDRRGCSLGVLTGKADLFDSNPAAVNPGGIPLFKGNTVVGGIGVVGDVPATLAEFAAFFGALAPPGTSVLPVPAFFVKSLNERVFIDGVRLPFVTLPVRKILKGKRPSKTRPDPNPMGEFVVSPRDGSCFDKDGNGGICRAAPEGYLIGPRAGSQLSVQEVVRIVQQSVETADRTRAQIRFPRGSKAKMMIAVSDVDGTLLAVYRMPDATIFSIDVATAKARNVSYFSSRAPQVRTDLPGVPLDTAISNRTLSFGSQPLYPPGIQRTNEGPFFFSLYVPDTITPCTQGTQETNPNQNGIVFFPGSLPLYKNDVLVGGLGVSGDGVEQDDYVTAGGAVGFEPAEALRADQFFVRGVRLAYLKFPRNPEE
jgi:uncharacterized protein GlcG (DUF336 family)